MNDSAVQKFKPGDRVRNINPSSAHYDKIADLVGMFDCYWPAGYPGGYSALNNACDVRYPGVSGPYGHLAIAQCADDLELAE